jgi:DhnA family fructose-bisphosphate aldolase class Ia
MSDVTYRLRRMFNPVSGRCLDIAVDHGFFGEKAFLQGIEDLPAAVDTLVAANPDAIQLTVGQARLPLPDHMFDLTLPNPGLAGVKLDAACVVVNLFELPGRPEVREACIRAVLNAKVDCEKYGMPLMVEPLVMKQSSKGGYEVNGDIERIIPIVRQAVELGADVIKADPTDDPSQYHEVIRTATGIPVLVRGGGRVEDDELLRRTQAVLEQGAAGIVYGRNIIQHDNPGGMTRALMAMLHDGADATAAAAIVSSTS